MNVNSGKYIDVEELRKQYGAFLESEGAFMFSVDTFPDLVTHDYIEEKYVGEFVINNKTYDVHASFTSFWMLGLPTPAFCFYTCYLSDDIPNHRVDEYANAHKLYRTEKLDPADFPMWCDLKGDFEE